MSKPPVKTSATSKPPAPKRAAAKAGKPLAAPAPRTPAQPAASPKPAAKPVAKAAAKPAPKPAPRPAPKPAAEPPYVPAHAPHVAAPPRPDSPVMTAVRAAVKADPKIATAWKHKAGRELSEQELLAMPDGEYMNDKQLDFFRARLQTQKDDLLSNAGETTEHLREDTTIVPDPADRATIEEEHALELRTRDRERKLLKKIAQSLTRLDNGEYGYCDETGEPIGLARLLARPTATLSLEAQQRRELKQKMFGD